ncbi:hypothetical protein [Streptomyces sp. NPDC006527]|uniref:hypothetical protein n=1 Tax=Streptomyces sp. NPDC006527 TaxID=3364749 RepID=UPI00367E217C
MRDRLARVLIAATMGLTLPVAVTAPAVASPTAHATVRAPELVPLMGLTNLSLTLTQAGDNWTVKVTATETFTQSELGQRFADAANVFERDTGEPFGGDDDHLAFTFEEGFDPTSTQETITFTWQMTSDHLDTEDGSERIYGEVKLRNVTTGGGPIFARTPITTIDP